MRARVHLVDGPDAKELPRSHPHRLPRSIDAPGGESKRELVRRCVTRRAHQHPRSRFAQQQRRHRADERSRLPRPGRAVQQRYPGARTNRLPPVRAEVPRAHASTHGARLRRIVSPGAGPRANRVEHRGKISRRGSRRHRKRLRAVIGARDGTPASNRGLTVDVPRAVEGLTGQNRREERRDEKGWRAVRRLEFATRRRRGVSQPDSRERAGSAKPRLLQQIGREDMYAEVLAVLLARSNQTQRGALLGPRERNLDNLIRRGRRR